MNGYYLFSIVIGIGVALQSAINNQLKIFLGGSTLLAAFVSFVVGSLCLLIICLCYRENFSVLLQLKNANSWLLTGGALGAVFVFGTTLLAPKIGLSSMLSLLILGQILSSLLIDKFGLIGLTAREISPTRIIGFILIVIGVFCVNFGKR